MSTHVGHAHDRATAAARSRSVLALTLALTVAFMLVELVAGFWTGSLALLADAGHMLTDAGALGLALFATWIAARPPTPAKTYGYYRAEILAALVNALLLLVVSGAIFTEAWRRWQAPAPVLAGPMAAVAAAGLGINVVCAWLLHRGAAGSLNVRAAYLEVVSDALSSLATLVAAGIVLDGFRRSLTLNPGFRTDHLLAMTVDTSLVGRSNEESVRFLRASQ